MDIAKSHLKKNSDPHLESLHLNFLRTLIDNIDSAIISILAHRAQIVNYIIEYKSLHNITASQSAVRQDVIHELLNFSTSLQLRKTFVHKLLTHLFEVSGTFLQAHPEIHPYFFESSELLGELNNALKHLDMALCSLLSERMQLVKQIGKFKNIHGVKPLDATRWQQVLSHKMETANSLHISPDAIRDFYNLIHEEALYIESTQN